MKISICRNVVHTKQSLGDFSDNPSREFSNPVSVVTFLYKLAFKRSPHEKSNAKLAKDMVVKEQQDSVNTSFMESVNLFTRITFFCGECDYPVGIYKIGQR